MKPELKRYLTTAAVTAAVLVLALVGNLISSKGVPDREAGELRVIFYDCGEADCILLQADGFNMLIDTGGEEYESSIGRLKRAGVKRLDCFVITHFDSDHSAGSARLIEEFDPPLILMPYADANARKTVIYQQLSLLNREFTEAITGQKYSLSGMKIQVLAPNNSAYTEDNESSVVLRCEYDGASFLFAADTTEPEEAVMVSKYGGELKCDVLKVAHHGAASSSGEAFLQASSPEYAVISCGYNAYGHPSEQALQRLSACGAKVYTTWESGDIAFFAKHGEITIFCSENK